MSRSPEALRIYFSGPAALKLLESKELSAHESKIIEAAIATAQTANPDLKILREADAVVQRLEHPRGETERDVWSPAGPDESSLASLSGDFNPEKELEPSRHTMLGRYIRWQQRRYRWRTFYAPIVLLGIIFVAYLLVTRVPGVKERLQVSDALPIPANSAQYEEAVARCEKIGKHLPDSVDRLKSRLSKIPDYKAGTGYWLSDGRIYIPAKDTTVPRDKGFHWIVCVEE